MANIFEFLSKDGNITPEKARKSRQMQFHDKKDNMCQIYAVDQHHVLVLSPKYGPK